MCASIFLELQEKQPQFVLHWNRTSSAL